MLQLRYHFTPRDWGAAVRLTAAQLKPAVWARQIYWQVVLPPQEHLLFSPSDYTREFYWIWDRLGYRREPTLQQPELEAWIGATAGELPPATANRYLFSSLGPQIDLEIWTVKRSGLVFISSLAMLLVGLVLIYVPSARHPSALFVAAIVLLAGALLEPEVAMLLAQAAALGLILALMAAWLARRMSRRLAPAVVAPRRVVDHGALDHAVAPAQQQSQQSSQHRDVADGRANGDSGIEAMSQHRPRPICPAAAPAIAIATILVGLAVAALCSCAASRCGSCRSAAARR